MSDQFKLDQRLKNDGVVIGELGLCQLIFIDNCLFPWVILVPKISGMKDIIDLDSKGRILLAEEVNIVSEKMKEIFKPDKLNVASLGNIVSQLHVHIVARYENDEAWPNPVFGFKKKAYSLEKREEIISLLKKSLNLK